MSNTPKQKHTAGNMEVSLARTTLHLRVDGHPVAAISTHNSCAAERAEFRAQCEANAARLALCWNAHDSMLAALTKLADPNNYDAGGWIADSDPMTIATLALAKVDEKTTKQEDGR